MVARSGRGQKVSVFQTFMIVAPSRHAYVRAPRICSVHGTGKKAAMAAWASRGFNKKTDVIEPQKAFIHVGLLFNGSPGSAGQPFI